jgi:hypothetical protein
VGSSDGLQLVIYGAIAVLVVWRVVVRQVRGSVVTVRGLVLMPGILLLLGIFTIARALPDAGTTEAELLVGDLALLVVLGVARAASTHLGMRDGYAFQKGTGLTLALWLATIAIRIGFAVAGAQLHTTGALTSASILLTVGLSIGVQNVIIFTRARRRELPIATSKTSLAGR